MVGDMVEAAHGWMQGNLVRTTSDENPIIVCQALQPPRLRQLPVSVQ